MGKPTANSKSMRALMDTVEQLSTTTLWNDSASLRHSCFDLSSTSKRFFLAGVETVRAMSQPDSLMASLVSFHSDHCQLRSFVYRMFIPRKTCSLPLVTVILSNRASILFMIGSYHSWVFV
jgi:hypothetical protein